MVHFCSKCSNMLYTQIGEESKLVFFCRLCGTVDKDTPNQGICVLKTQLKKDNVQISHITNKYTKLDPSLPAIYHIRCPNSACQTNIEKVEKPKILYMRYDDEHLKYLYICVSCDTTWSK